MDNLELFKDEFFIRLQRELEHKQEYLGTVLNPNEYIVINAKIEILKTIIDSYVNYLEEHISHDGSN